MTSRFLNVSRPHFHLKYWLDNLTVSCRTRRPWCPKASWLIPITFLFCKMAWNSGRMVRKSLDMISGEASTAQRAIWVCAWSILSEKSPMINWERMKYCRLLASHGHRSLIDTYHIRVIPISRSSKIGKFSFMVAIVINYVKDISERVLNITIISP